MGKVAALFDLDRTLLDTSAVNPDLRLRRLAQKQDWPIEMFY